MLQQTGVCFIFENDFFLFCRPMANCFAVISKIVLLISINCGKIAECGR